jgi:hypothetical protein
MSASIRVPDFTFSHHTERRSYVCQKQFALNFEVLPDNIVTYEMHKYVCIQ